MPMLRETKNKPVYRFYLGGHCAAFCADVEAAHDGDAYREALRFVAELLKENETQSADAFSFRVAVEAEDGRKICDIRSCGENLASPAQDEAAAWTDGPLRRRPPP